MGINRTRKPLKLNSAGISHTRALYVASAVRTRLPVTTKEVTGIVRRAEEITAEDSLSVTKETTGIVRRAQETATDVATEEATYVDRRETYKDALVLKTKEIRAKDSRDSIDGDKPLNSQRQRLSLRCFPHTWEFQVY